MVTNSSDNYPSYAIPYLKRKYSAPTSDRVVIAIEQMDYDINAINPLSYYKLYLRAYCYAYTSYVRVYAYFNAGKVIRMKVSLLIIAN